MKKAMNKAEFKRRWEKPDGGGITFGDIADCAEAWGLFSQPKIRANDKVYEAVLKEAGVEPDPCDACGIHSERGCLGCLAKVQ
jgi:hypothetical protein